MGAFHDDGDDDPWRMEHAIAPRAAAKEADSPITVATTIGLWCVQLLLTFLTLGWMFLSQLSIDSCTPAVCDYAAFLAAVNVFYASAIVLLVATTIAISMRKRMGWATVWMAAGGILVLVVALCWTYAISRAALDLPLFGPRS
ncbi:hypothetical protein LQ938_12635 [Microbacterium sp. cx-55]|uniref:hypothetical protein n=1 Tax=Microbacterium sp. cx-55 TaxID=2875948 RepID=UPI001CBE0A41|nr:hypothetical protein [Microbacterium sp. cx-55]MBZ4487885.1 hypothetical protein [Microbacterium sp. cx-55]UGB34704.1 hypothetical protein LQ938_12635 [Microbacterium sp. cx-55]